MIEINKCKLVPGITANWGEILGDITKQQDLVDYVSSHGGGGDAVWGSITGVLSDQTDLMTYMSSFATMSWVDAQGYLTEHQSLEGYATESWVSSQGYLTSVPSGYATESWVSSQGYLTSVPSGYATESWVSSQNYLTSTALTGYATESWVSSQGYLTEHQSLDGYATESWVSSQGYLTSVPSGYATESWVSSQGYITSSALSGYATESWVENKGYYQLSPGLYPVENRDILADPYVEDIPEDYPLVDYIGLSPMTIGYCDIGETWRFDGVRLDYDGAGIYTIIPVETEVEGETVIEYQEEYKPFALDEDLTSLTSRVSSLETNYGDAVTTTNNILGV